MRSTTSQLTATPGKDIYLDDDDRRLFLDVLAEVISRCSWICHACCLMDNHYHLLIETPDANFSLGMRQLNGVYTPSASTVAIGESGMCIKGGSRRFWSSAIAICWSWPANRIESPPGQDATLNF